MVIAIACDAASRGPIDGDDNEYFFLAESLNLRPIPDTYGNGQLSHWSADGHGVVPRWCHCYRNSNANRLICQFDNFHLDSRDTFHHCRLQWRFEFRLQQLSQSESISDQSDD